MGSANVALELQNSSAFAPPPGIVQNFTNPVSRGYVVLVVGSLLFTLMIIFLVVRIYMRFFASKQRSWGDVTCIIAALGATAYFAIQVIAVNHGLGKHLWDVRIVDLDDAFFITTTFLAVILVNPTLLATKLTLFAMYYEYFHPFRWMRICIYVGITITTGFYVVASILQLYHTIPRKGETWSTHAFTKQEYSAQNISVSLSGVGLGLDIYLLILPFKAVVDLYMPLGRKLAVSMVFLVGLLACVASSLCIYYKVISNPNKDATWNSVNIAITSIVEIDIGVIIACTSAMSKLVHTLPKIKTLQSIFPLKSSENEAGQSAACPITRQRSVMGNPGRVATSEDGYNMVFDRKPASSLKEYRTMENGADLPFELNHLRSVSTFIRSDKPKEVMSNDQIHLKQEIWQSS